MTVRALLIVFRQIADHVSAQLDGEHGKQRRFWIDYSALLKTPPSIESKINRLNTERTKKGASPVSVENYLEHIDDLARFRIVAYSEADLRKLGLSIDDALAAGPDGGWLSDHVECERRNDTIDAADGERSLKYKIRLRTDVMATPIRVEVQLVDAASDVWDALNHPFYELIRGLSNEAVNDDARAQLIELQERWRTCPEQHFDRQGLGGLVYATRTFLVRSTRSEPQRSPRPDETGVAHAGLARRPATVDIGLSVQWRNAHLIIGIESLSDVRTACRMIGGSRAGRWPPDRVVAVFDVSSASSAARTQHVLASELRDADGTLNLPLCDDLARRAFGGVLAMPPARVGGTVTADAFLGRMAVLRDLEELLHRCNRVVFAAPRRFGKTTCLRRLANDVQDRFHALFVDVGGCDSPAKFVRRIAEATCSHRSGWIPAVPVLDDPNLYDDRDRFRTRAFEDLQRGLRTTWKPAFRELLSGLAAAPKAPLLIIDEFAWMIENLAPTGGSVQQARDVIDLVTEAAQDPMRIVLCGSLYLPHFLRARGLDELQDWHEERLPAWRPSEPDVMVRLLMMGAGLMPDDEAVAAVLEEVGIEVPFFTQMLVDAVAARVHTARIAESAALVRSAHADLVRGRNHPYQDIEAQLERYSEYLGNANAHAAAEAMLDLAAQPNGATNTEIRRTGRQALATGGAPTSEEAIDFLLDLLRHDVYLHAPQPDRWAFGCRAFARWWQLRGSR